MVDARTLRSRARLHAAVLELATETGLDGLSVTAIADRAGVHRSTFYEHAATPVQLLQGALGVELDALRAEYLVDVAPDELRRALRDVTLGVLRHVDDHAAIYRHLDDDDGLALQTFLSSHFQESSRVLLRSGALELGGIAGSGPDAQETAIRFIADGVVGAIAVWLREPAPRDPQALLTLLAQLLPAWWPLA